MFGNARKAVLTFLLSVATNAVADFMSDGYAFPTSWEEAARWVITIVVSTAGVYAIKPAKGVDTPPAVTTTTTTVTAPPVAPPPPVVEYDYDDDPPRSDRPLG